MTTPTDRLGTPLAPGDEILYADKRRGGGGKLSLARIRDIIPLVPYRGNTDGFMREDQLGKSHPTFFPIKPNYVDADKQFVLRMEVVHRWNDTETVSTFTLHRLVDVVKVPQ